MTRKKYEKPDLNGLSSEKDAVPDRELDGVTGGVVADQYCLTGPSVTTNCYNGTGANECCMGNAARHTTG